MSAYHIYKLSFPNGLHIGTGTLSSSSIQLMADTLFSALFIEAMKAGREQELYNATACGSLKISDGFPYYKERYFLPKPMLRIEGNKEGSSLEKKFYKKLQYIPADLLKAFLEGRMDLCDKAKSLYTFTTRTMAAVRREEDTLPYQIGICSFCEGAGLYIIARTSTDAEQELLEELLDSVSMTGIGGERSSGLGRFTVTRGVKGTEFLLNHLAADGGEKLMLLSCALPKEEEMDKALSGASYTVVRRGGFIGSDTFATEQMKKRTLYMFGAGSCFVNPFEGDIYDVSDNKGAHPVFRYAKPLFLAL